MPRAQLQVDERKRDATRRVLLDSALALFQKHGVEAATMRDIAKAAGLSLGAAYYYFPSKDALVFAYYEATQAELEALAERVTGTLRERLGALFHHKIESVRPQRKMLATIVHRLIDPSDPLSAFSEASQQVRERAIGVFERALAAEPLSADVRALAARALWLVMLAVLLALIRDRSARATRTHALVDEILDLVVPLVPLLATPMGRALCERVTRVLPHFAAVAGSSRRVS